MALQFIIVTVYWRNNNFYETGMIVRVKNFHIGYGYLPTCEYGKGAYLYFTSGKKYLDASSGPITCDLGHANGVVLVL